MTKWTQQFGEWALVTGASSGIGAEFARQLASAGMNVVLLARRRNRLEDLSKALAAKFGVETLIIELDLSKEGCIKNIANETKNIDIGLVISNAGDGAMGGFLKQDVNKFVSAINLNISNPVQLAHHFLKLMYDKQKKGGYLFVSSGVAVAGAPYIGDYSATKAYQLNLGQALHYELASYNIKVTVLMPGPTRTEAYSGRDDIDFSKMPMPPMTVERVVKVALNGLMKNKAVVIPGGMNKVMDFMTRRIMSRKMTSKMFGFLMKGLVFPKYRY